MSVVTVCKNVIQSNNKRGWVNPEPAIRIANTRSGKATERGSLVAIKDREGNEIAWIATTTDGKPIVKCGAKVAITTKYPVEVFE